MFSLNMVDYPMSLGLDLIDPRSSKYLLSPSCSKPLNRSDTYNITGKDVSLNSDQGDLLLLIVTVGENRLDKAAVCCEKRQGNS